MAKKLFPEEEVLLPAGQQDPEQVLQQLAAAPSEKEQAQAEQPETDLEIYQRLSREAEQAAPTEQDVLSAGFRRSMAEQRATIPAYLQQQAETLFYKPDYSDRTKVAQAEAEKPDVQLTAKQQAQKRLQDLAEVARKRALLPGQMESEKAKLEQTKAKTAESVSKLAPIEGVRKTVLEKEMTSIAGRPIDLTGLTENDANMLLRAFKQDKNTGMSEYQKARLRLSERGLGLAEEKAKDLRAKQATKETKEQLGRGVEYQGQEYTARSDKEAQDLRNSVSAVESINSGLDEIKQKYGNLSIKDLQNAPREIEQIGTIGKDLIMNIKEFYNLGAPQQAELQFLYNLISSSPSEIGKTIISDNTIGTSLPAKLDTIKRRYNNLVQIYLNKKAVPAESVQTSKGEETSAEKPAAPKTSQEKKPKPKKRKVSSADDLP